MIVANSKVYNPKLNSNIYVNQGHSCEQIKRCTLSKFILISSFSKIYYYRISLEIMNKNNKIYPQQLPPHRPNSDSKAALPEAQTSAICINKASIEEQKNSHAVPNLIEIAQSVPPPVTLYTCRICLQQHPALHANNQQQLKSMLLLLEEQQKLKKPKHVITACRCQGTAGYVHQKCMIQWIDSLYKRSNQKQMKCQICLEQILYDRKTIPYFEMQCKNFENVSACNFACIISVLMMLILFIVLQTQATNLKFNQMTIITIYVLIGVVVVTLVIWIRLIIKEAFYKIKKETIKVYSNDQIQICGILKDNLTHYDRRSTTYRAQTNARSIRSVRSVREINISRVNQASPPSRSSRNQENHPHSHRQRSQRPPKIKTQARQAGQGQHIRSQRVIRSARSIASTRSIQVRSRPEIEQPVQI